MLGSFQNADNAATLAGYIQLLNESGLICSLQKYPINTAKRKVSIPKYQVLVCQQDTIYVEI